MLKCSNGWVVGAALLEMKIMIAMVIRSLEMHDAGATIRCMRSPSLQPAVGKEGSMLPLRVVPISTVI